MAINLPSCFLIQFLEQLLKLLVNFTLLKYVKSQRSHGFLITKELIFGFQIFYLKDRFSASLSTSTVFYYFCLMFFVGLLKIIPLGVGFTTIFLLWFHTFFVPRGGGWEIRPLKIPCGMVRLGID